MSKIKNGRLDLYGAEPFEQQQFETAGVEGVTKVTRLRRTLAGGRVMTAVRDDASSSVLSTATTREDLCLSV